MTGMYNKQTLKGVANVECIYERTSACCGNFLQRPIRPSLPLLVIIFEFSFQCKNRYKGIQLVPHFCDICVTYGRAWIYRQIRMGHNSLIYNDK